MLFRSVEDDATLRSDLAGRLELWGHEVFEAGNAKAGFQLIVQKKPELILCDICMPSESGFELLKRVRALGVEHADTPFILVSALREEKATFYGEYCGANSYITKPIDYKELYDKVHSHLSRPKARFSGIGAVFSLFR